MTTTAHITPLQRQALLAALQSPTHTLRRMRGGYVALGADVTTSGPATAHAFTGRMMNMLYRDNLVDFDQPTFPDRVTLNAHGREIAEQLRTRAVPKAGAA